MSINRPVKYALIILGILACLYPIYLLSWVETFSEAHGCVVNESGPRPCVVDGFDWGPKLANALVSGWFLLVTIPIALVLAIVLAIMALKDIARLIRNKRQT